MILSVILCLASINYLHCFAISTFCLSSYMCSIYASDSEHSSPSPFHSLSPRCYTALGKKRPVTYVQHCSSLSDQHLPPFQYLTCSFSSMKTRRPLHIRQCFRSFHLTGSIACQFLRGSLHLPSLKHTCLHLTTQLSLLVIIPPTRVSFALLYSPSTWNLTNGIGRDFSLGSSSFLSLSLIFFFFCRSYQSLTPSTSLFSFFAVPCRQLIKQHPSFIGLLFYIGQAFHLAQHARIYGEGELRRELPDYLS